MTRLRLAGLGFGGRAPSAEAPEARALIPHRPSDRCKTL